MSASSPAWCRSLAEQSLGPFEDLHDAPPLGGRQRTSLHQQHPVADAALLLVVRLQLAGGALDAQVEQLRLGFAQLDHQVLVGQLAQFGGTGAGCHQTSTPSRLTMRHFIGSLWIARRIASRAICSFGKDISKRIRPGLMLATHHSGEPLPEPIRVSAGFLVIAWSGNTVIQTLPPRRMCRG